MKKVIIVLILILFVSGCDTFFIIGTSIIDDRTGEPISGAKATLVLDDQGIEEPDIVEISSRDGVVGMFMNEPETAWATLTIEKGGYNKWSTQFRGAPRKPFVVRLIPLDND